jgi:hypothetical protein
LLHYLQGHPHAAVAVYGGNQMTPMLNPPTMAKLEVNSLYRAPSAGAVIKKIHEINPEMSTHEMIALVRRCTRPRGKTANEFASVEILDEELALELARQSLGQANSAHLT